MAEKILIVDDDLDTLKLVGLILQRQGYQIVAASSGSQGLAKASAERPDLILLDVMMPDMEGYEVTRRLRSDSELSHVPIIMFTAKTMVDDKVAGFEAGVDDYMTKPTHPKELVSRVRALLARSAAAKRPAAQAAVPTPVERGKILGVFGAKGGLGVSTLALNIAVAVAQTRQDVILCELRPGQGTLGLQLGFSHSESLNNLLKKNPNEITPQAIERQLVSHANSGLRLLLASSEPSEVSLMSAVAQAEQLIRQAALLTKFLVVDLGTGLPQITKKAIMLCDKHLMVVEPMRVTLTLAKALLKDLERAGLTANRVDLVMMNRVRSSLQMPWQQAETLLNHSIAAIITPAPELSYQAAEGAVPMILIEPDSLTADQIRKLAQFVVQGPRKGATGRL